MIIWRFLRRHWLTIALVIGLLALVGLVAVGLSLFQAASQLAKESMHPPRSPISRTPADVGITNYQDVSFPASDGVTIRGWLIPGSNGAMILLGHGNQGNRSQMLDEAAILAGQGYGVLMFDWRGEGESDGDVISFGQLETRDLRGAVDFVLTQPGVDPALPGTAGTSLNPASGWVDPAEPGTAGTSLNPASGWVDPARIGGLGFSLGGAAMTLGAAQDDRIKALIVESSFASLDETVGYRTGNTPFLGALTVQIGQREAGIDAGQVRPVDALCQISPRPVLLIYGAEDDTIPPGSAEKMFASACDPKGLWVVPGAGHGGFMDAAPEEYAARIVAYFDQNLLR